MLGVPACPKVETDPAKRRMHAMETTMLSLFDFSPQLRHLKHARIIQVPGTSTSMLSGQRQTFPFGSYLGVVARSLLQSHKIDLPGLLALQLF